MQSIDFSVAAAKEEMRRRGVIASAQMRQPAAKLDEISQRQLDRWIAERLPANSQ
jgi:dihydrodipicolinate synthase/N-acetylneuraminate lyase